MEFCYDSLIKLTEECLSGIKEEMSVVNRKFEAIITMKFLTQNLLSLEQIPLIVSTPITIF